MRIDSALKEFTEKYNQAMFEAVDELSNNFGYNANGYKMCCINITESTEMFEGYLVGYKDYVLKHPNEVPPHDQILERTNEFIDQNLFKAQAVPYKELPKFIESYVSSIRKITEATESIKSIMEDANIDQEKIGNINAYVDSFIEKMQESFYPCMDKIIWASGYNTRQRLSGTYMKENKSKSKPIFV